MSSTEQSQVDEMSSTEQSQVVVTDIKMPFESMVIFLIKLAIAAIPASIIISIIFAILYAIFVLPVLRTL